jgi:hypothetical protein
MTPVTRARPTVTVGAISIEPIARGAVPAGSRPAAGDARAIGRAATPPPAEGARRRRRPPNLALTFAVLGSATMSFTLLRAGEILVSDLMFLLAAIVIAVKLLNGDDRSLTPASGRRGSPLILAGALLLLIAGTLSSLRAWEPLSSIRVVARFGWVTLVWFWIMRAVCRDRDDFNRVLRGWRIASLATAGAAVLGLMGLAFVSTHAGERQVGLSGHPNHLAGQLVATFPLFLLAVPHREGRRPRLRWLVPLALCSSAIFSSGSLAGLTSVVASLAVMGIAYVTTRTPREPRRRRSPLAPLAVMAVLVLGTLALVTSDLAVVERLNLFREGDSGVEQSINARGDRNALVTSKFDEFLVVGLGFTYETAGADNDTTILDNPAIRNYGVHNMHLGLLYQAGLAAVVGVLLILTTAIRQLMGLMRRADTELYLTTLALIGSFTAVNVNAMFQPTSFDRFYWMPVALTGCLWSIRRNELRRAADERAAAGANGSVVASGG